MGGGWLLRGLSERVRDDGAVELKEGLRCFESLNGIQKETSGYHLSGWDGVWDCRYCTLDLGQILCQGCQ